MQTLGLRAFQRVLVLAIAGVLGLGAAWGLTGCSADESVIRFGIDQDLSVFKDPTEENLKEYISRLGNADPEVVEASAKDMAELSKHLLRGFDYTIDSVTVNGTVATADITITNVDVAHAYETAFGSEEALKNDPEVQAFKESGDAEGYNQWFLAKFYDALDQETQTTSSKVTMRFSKEGNDWHAEPESIEELSRAIYGNIDGMGLPTS